jgi:catechol 2,3-dioxygenase-like lactoylglutathione lyase family enzyme
VRRLYLLAGALALTFQPLIAEQLSQATATLSIAHAAMRVSDLAKSREFYRKLGFEEAFVLEKNGSPSEVFLKVNDRQFIELYPLENDSQPPGFMHVCFESSDLEGLSRLYRERGVSTTAVSRGSAGNLLFSIKYPEQQVIEFTEYMPASMHSNDRGKHLGEHRISKHIAAVGMPVEDPAAAITFYEDKLGFRRDAFSLGRGEAMLLPGASGEIVEMLPRAREPAFTLFFSVSDLRQAESALSHAHLSVDKHEATLSIVDPDGNRIVFIKN